MKMFRHLSSVFAIATIAPLALAATLAATPAIAQADQLPNPDWVALLSDYEKNYWQAPTDAGHGGKVLHADTMKLDEDLAVAITLDLFFLCQVADDTRLKAMDDVADSFWLPLDQVDPEKFGLDSVREGVKRFLSMPQFRKD